MKRHKNRGTGAEQLSSQHPTSDSDTLQMPEVTVEEKAMSRLIFLPLLPSSSGNLQLSEPEIVSAYLHLSSFFFFL